MLTKLSDKLSGGLMFILALAYLLNLYKDFSLIFWGFFNDFIGYYFWGLAASITFERFRTDVAPKSVLYSLYFVYIVIIALILAYFGIIYFLSGSSLFVLGFTILQIVLMGIGWKLFGNISQSSEEFTVSTSKNSRAYGIVILLVAIVVFLARIFLFQPNELTGSLSSVINFYAEFFGSPEKMIAWLVVLRYTVGEFLSSRLPDKRNF